MTKAMKLFDSTRIPILNKALDAYSSRQKVIASNIANIGTIGYRSKAVVFQRELQGAMEQPVITPVRTNEMHLNVAGLAEDGETVKVVDAATTGLAPGESTDNGANNVNIDHEMAELAKNQIRFKFASKLLGDSFRGLQKSIRGIV
jgi:flagellar basal-body rod protein FlgB